MDPKRYLGNGRKIALMSILLILVKPQTNNETDFYVTQRVLVTLGKKSQQGAGKKNVF